MRVFNPYAHLVFAQGGGITTKPPRPCRAFGQRSALKRSAGAALLLSKAAIFEQLARALAATSASAAAPSFPDIQFDLGAFTAAAKTFNDGGGNVSVSLPPVYTLFQPLTLNRTPTTGDQAVFANALNTIEQASPSGALIFAVSYGLPYFRRLNQATVKAHMPTLLSNSSTPVLQEATPSPSDVVNGLVGRFRFGQPRRHQGPVQRQRAHRGQGQQVSRASDGTPLHIRNAGPGFDSMDMPAYNTSGSGNTGGVFVTKGTNIPAGSNMFKLQFAIFVPNSDFFSRMRTAAAAAQNLQAQFLGGESDNNGLERHITATRRQNFLVPPRRHRSMPLTELH
jgi:hypothetical protein